MAQVHSEDLVAVITVLKKRFPNLQAVESVQIATEIILAIVPAAPEPPDDIPL